MSTIAAISTATGAGGIGIIRMSGKNCFTILEKIFKPIKKENIEEIKGYTMKFGHILDSETGDIIDEVLVSYFKSPKSYTTENMCEINSHGGIVVERKILEQCLLNGAELAEPGEFTKRAFLNGRIDLCKAEGIIDLINAKTESEAKASIKQLEGSLSKKINEIKKEILNIMADIEASIDYPEYDIEETTNEKAKRIIENIKEEMEKLEKSFDTGKILKDGIKTAIIGKPNAGKSSLLNTILNEDRAIVSEIEGTTRDTIEEYINIRGISLKIIDTAGIRKTTDKIEEIGVNKAISLAEDSDLIIAIFDNTKELEEDDDRILDLIKDKKGIILLNKIDLKNSNLENNNKIKLLNKPVIKISAKNKIGIEELYNTILNMFEINEIELNDGNIITNIRHKNQITRAVNTLEEALKVIEDRMPIDILAIYLKQTLEEISSITGDNVSQDIIDEIFKKFCLGK